MINLNDYAAKVQRGGGPESKKILLKYYARNKSCSFETNAFGRVLSLLKKRGTYGKAY
ncbi:MAG: hypothetical protein LUE98_02875 [Tannerellaceae bacterium]|nr:hypothetical protein [Tannerellaceae bacterium]